MIIIAFAVGFLIMMFGLFLGAAWAAGVAREARLYELNKLVLMRRDP